MSTFVSSVQDLSVLVDDPFFWKRHMKHSFHDASHEVSHFGRVHSQIKALLVQHCFCDVPINLHHFLFRRLVQPLRRFCNLTILSLPPFTFAKSNFPFKKFILFLPSQFFCKIAQKSLKTNFFKIPKNEFIPN